MDVILYGTQYGTAKAYAEELGCRTGIKVVEHSDAGDINAYDTIVYIGALYAGGVQGMKKTFAKLRNPSSKTIVIATVGLADPEVKLYTDELKANIRRQLRSEVYDAAQIFHLRGGIDYSRLGLKHKAMMSLLYKKVKSLPEEKMTADAKAMIETYNKQVDFVDFETLAPIEQAIQSV